MPPHCRGARSWSRLAVLPEADMIARRRGGQSMYAGPIVDGHTHLWDLSMGKHAWLMPSDGSVQALGGLEKLRHDFVVADYLRDSANQNIVATVHIEALWDRSDVLGETR